MFFRFGMFGPRKIWQPWLHFFVKLRAIFHETEQSETVFLHKRILWVFFPIVVAKQTELDLEPILRLLNLQQQQQRCSRQMKKILLFSKHTSLCTHSDVIFYNTGVEFHSRRILYVMNCLERRQLWSAHT
jgi:hypothetical protein